MKTPSTSMDEVIRSLEQAREALKMETTVEIFTTLESYANVEEEDLRVSVGRNVSLAISSLRAWQAPEPSELREAVTTTVERFHSGVSIDQVILAFRMSFSRIHEYFLNASLGVLEAEELVQGSQILSRVSDAFTSRAVNTFHRLVVDSAIADASRRAAALKALLAGGAGDLPLQFNAEELYAVITAEVPRGENVEHVRRELEASGSKPGAPAMVVIEDEKDCVGIVSVRPQALSGVLVGIGPFVRLKELPVSHRVALRSLQVATQLRRSGVQGIPELNWRLAAFRSEEVGNHFRQRFIDPVLELGEFAPDILSTMYLWLSHGRSMAKTASLQKVHVNTVRYRISKFSDLTGFDAENLDDGIGLAWVLEVHHSGQRLGSL